MNITIKNSDGTFDITQLVTIVSISGDYQQCSRTLDFSMVSSPIDNSIPSIRCELGNAVTLTENNEIMFQGNIFSRQKSTNGNTIDVTCFDRGFYLKNNRAENLRRFQHSCRRHCIHRNFHYEKFYWTQFIRYHSKRIYHCI